MKHPDNLSFRWHGRQQIHVIYIQPIQYPPPRFSAGVCRVAQIGSVVAEQSIAEQSTAQHSSAQHGTGTAELSPAEHCRALPRALLRA